jgi:hypothetical protein
MGGVRIRARYTDGLLLEGIDIPVSFHGIALVAKAQCDFGAKGLMIFGAKQYDVSSITSTDNIARVVEGVWMLLVLPGPLLFLTFDIVIFPPLILCILMRACIDITRKIGVSGGVQPAS